METNWLGISINLNEGYLHTFEERISDLLETFDYITYDPYISVQTQAKVVGKIISTKSLFVDITQLKARLIYQCIESSVFWNKKFNFNIYCKMVEEVLFWKFNIRKLNEFLYSCEIPHFFIDSYVINPDLPSLYRGNSKLNIGMKNFDFIKGPNSSTSRELETIR